MAAGQVQSGTVPKWQQAVWCGGWEPVIQALPSCSLLALSPAARCDQLHSRWLCPYEPPDQQPHAPQCWR